MPSLKLTIENTEYNKLISIEIPNTDCRLGDFIEDLVIPALHAYGYHHDSIEEIFANQGEIYEHEHKKTCCPCCSR